MEQTNDMVYGDLHTQLIPKTEEESIVRVTVMLRVSNLPMQAAQAVSQIMKVSLEETIAQIPHSMIRNTTIYGCVVDCYGLNFASNAELGGFTQGLKKTFQERFTANFKKAQNS